MSAVSAPDVVGRSFSFTLLSGRDAPFTARRAIAGHAGAWLDDETRFKLDLLLTEIVTNAVQHGEASAASPIRVDGVMLGRWLEVEVTNIGRPLEHEVGLPPETATGGRGLAIVDALASRWGTQHERGGTTVWFELENGFELPAARSAA